MTMDNFKKAFIRITLPEEERLLFDYSPETILVEDSTVLDVLKVSDMTIKLIDEVKIRLGNLSIKNIW